MKRIVIVDLWTNSNNGDEVLQSGLISMLKKKFPDSKISGVFRFGFNEFNQATNEIERTLNKLDSYFPGPRRTLYAGNNALKLSPGLHLLYSIFSFCELFLNLLFYKLNLHSFCNKKVLQTFVAISNAEIVIWKGKNFRDYKGLKGLFRLSTLLILGYVSTVLNKNVYCINASIWKMQNKFQKFLLDFVFRKCKHVTVRDEDSLCHFVESDYIDYSYCADLSFYDLGANYSSYHLRGFNVTKKYDVALTLTEWGNEDDQNRYVNNLFRILSLLRESKNYESIIIVPQVNRIAESNQRVKNLLLEKLNTTQNFTITDYSSISSVDDLLKLYSESNFLIGTRMHSCVFSFFVGTPFIAIAYDNGPKWSILRKIWPSNYILDYYSADFPNNFNFEMYDKTYYQIIFSNMLNNSYSNIKYVE